MSLKCFVVSRVLMNDCVLRSREEGNCEVQEVGDEQYAVVATQHIRAGDWLVLLPSDDDDDDDDEEDD